MNNDLISRSELRKKIEKYKYKSTLNSLFLDGLNCMFMDCISEIDNAPAVDTYTIEDIQKVREDSLILGAKLAQRPEGEWIENNYSRIQCSICKGAAISTMTGCLVDRHLEQYKTKFCPWCGADMRKGSAE